jgi:hypothetical protein
MSLFLAAPMYVGISLILCSSYSCIECTKNKGKFDSTTKSMIFSWFIITFIVGFIISGASFEMMSGMVNTTHLLVAGMMACVTLIISCGMVYWA